MDSYQILGLSYGADIEDVKRCYKKIALQNHPDKIQHCNYTDEEKKEREETFRNATRAYQSILSGGGDTFFHFSDDDDTQYMDMFASTFSDIASKMFDYYHANIKTVHEVRVACTYIEIVKGCKKRCTMGCASFVVSCDKYPKTTVFQAVNGIEHEFVVHFELSCSADGSAAASQSVKYVENRSNGSIEVHLSIPISMYDYVQGSARSFSLFEHDYRVDIPAFSKKTIVLNEENITGNTIHCHIKLSLPTKVKMSTLDQRDYKKFMEILRQIDENKGT